MIPGSVCFLLLLPRMNAEHVRIDITLLRSHTEMKMLWSARSQRILNGMGKTFGALSLSVQAWPHRQPKMTGPEGRYQPFEDQS